MAQTVKESACNARDLGLIPGSGRSPGEGNGYSLQPSCLENSTDRRAWQAIVHGVTELEMVTSVYAYGCPQSRVDVGLSFPRLENEEERCAGRSLQDNFVHE